jgi:hypothetical protein
MRGGSTANGKGALHIEINDKFPSLQWKETIVMSYIKKRNFKLQSYQQ